MKLCLILCLSLLTFSPAQAARSLVDRTVVTVNDEIILESDIDHFQRKLKARSYQELLGVDEKVVTNRESVLQLLVEEKIIDQQVKKLDLKASEPEIDGQIRSILKRNGITQSQLESRLKQLGTGMADYREGLRRQIERHNLLEREIKPTLEITEEQLRHFYLRNSGPADKETQFKIAHILIDGAKPGATERAKKVHETVSKAPAQFEATAKEASDDESTAETGGSLGFFSLSQLAKEFRDIVPKTAVGNVTPPIKTQAGFHIVKVLEKSSGDFSKLSRERKEALRDRMRAVELEKKMGMWLERKKSEAHIRRFTGGNNGK